MFSGVIHFEETPVTNQLWMYSLYVSHSSQGQCKAHFWNQTINFKARHSGTDSIVDLYFQIRNWIDVATPVLKGSRPWRTTIIFSNFCLNLGFSLVSVYRLCATVWRFSILGCMFSANCFRCLQTGTSSGAMILSCCSALVLITLDMSKNFLKLWDSILCGDLRSCWSLR